MTANESNDGVAAELRENEGDIIVREGDGDDIFVKVFDRVLLLSRGEAHCLQEELDGALTQIKYAVVDGDGDPIPGERYDNPDDAIDARARLMGERDEEVRVREVEA